MHNGKRFVPCIRQAVLLAIGLLAALPGAGRALPRATIDSLYTYAKISKRMDAVREIVGQLNSALPEADDPAGLLTRIGTLYLRLEEADSAAAAFRQAIGQDSTLAAAHRGLGQVLLDLNNSPRTALENLETAVALDSTDAEAHLLLARAYLQTAKIAKARQAADRAIRHDPSYAPPYLFLAKIYQRERNEQAAHAFFKKYLEQNPADQSAAYEFAVELVKQKKYKEAEELAVRLGDTRGLPILAQTLIQERDYESAVAVFQRYMDTLPPEEQAAYEDISLVGLPHEIKAYQSTTPETREAYLRSFWLKKDPFKTSAGAMRRAEHYRRVWYARTFFGEKKYPWDRRGEVYIRYGEPDYRSSWRELNAQVPLPVQRVQEKMAYQLYGNKALPYTFVGPVYPIRSDQASEVKFRNTDVQSQSQPLQTMDETLIGLERYKPVTVTGDWSSVPWEVWIYADIDNGIEIAFTDEFNSGMFDFAPMPVLSAADISELNMQRDGPMRRMWNQITLLSPAARLERVASREPERFDFSALEPLDFYYEALTFRGPDGKTDVQINVALPIDKVARPDDIDTTVVVQRRVALLGGRTDNTQKRRDNLAVPVSDASLGRGLLAMDRVDIEADPGTYQLAVEAWRTNTDMLQVYQQTVTLPNYGSGKLMLSDLQIAQQVVEAAEGAGSKFIRGKWDILPAPARTFIIGSPFFVYFEIYNLQRDAFGNTRYEVAYEVVSKSTDTTAPRTFLPRIRKDGEAIEVRYEQVGTEERVADFVELDLGQADPGRYALRMVVKDLNSGQDTSRESIFKITVPPRTRRR